MLGLWKDLGCLCVGKLLLEQQRAGQREACCWQCSECNPGGSAGSLSSF